MGLRRAMNRRDVARFHAFLNEDLSVKKISEIMKIEIGTLNNFLPEKVAVSDDAKAKVAKKAAEKKVDKAPAKSEAADAGPTTKKA